MSVLVVQNTTPSLEINRTQPVIVLSAGLLNSGAAGGVTSVGLTAPADLTVTGSPVTGAGTLALSRNTQSANLFLGGPSSGVAAVPDYRALVPGDIPQLTGTQMPAFTGDITTSAGSTATALKAVGTAGTYGSASVIPVITTDAEGRVSDVTLATVAAGTVSSVALAAPSILTVTGSPVTSSGTLTLALASQSQNEVFASPSGAAGAPGFRSLVLGDLPAGVGELAATQRWTGVNTFTQATSISSVVLNQSGTSSANALYDGGSNSIGVRAGPSTAEVYFSFEATGIFKASSGGGSFAGPITNNIGTVAAYSAVAPSAVTVGASPWTYQNTNAYGVFLHIYGVTAVGSSLAVSANNSTYVTVATGGGDESTYVPPGFYAQFTFTTAPSGASIVPV